MSFWGHTVRRRWATVAGLAVFAVLTATLRPEEPPGGVNVTPLDHHWRAFRAALRGGPRQQEILLYLLYDVVGNVLLFVPVGVALAGLSRARHLGWLLLTTVGLAATLSISVELVQRLIPGRTTDIDDVIFNTLGALLGALGLVLYRRRRRVPV